jgi:hypothetical protein
MSGSGVTPGKGGVIATGVGLATGATLPVTGADHSLVVIVATAVAAALLAWGLVYAVSNRVR